MLASTKEELEANMKLLLPEYADKIPVSLDKQPISVIASKIPGYLFQAVILIAFAVGVYIMKPEWLLPEILVFVGIILIWVTVEILRYRTVGLLCDGAGLALADGVFAKRIVYLDYNKMQTIKMKQGPFRKKYHLHQGELHILAATLYSTYITGSYPEPVFEQIHQGMLRKS